MSATIGRRSAVASFIAAMAAFLPVGGQSLYAVLTAKRRNDPFTSAFPLLFSDPQGARTIGRRYLSIQPAEADPVRLKMSLFGSLEDLSPAALRTQLAERRRQDFAGGQTIIFDGWILARSEVRACALLSVLSQA